MTLERGTRLGPYQIESPIGAGGMGEVYKATDTRLERTVAIKVLPAHRGLWGVISAVRALADRVIETGREALASCWRMP